MRITTFDKTKNEEIFVGMYDTETRTLNKPVNRENFMIKEAGYGIQEDVVVKLRDLGCEKIVIKADNILYEFPMPLLETQSPKDYGHGMQRFLKKREGKIIRPPTKLPPYLRKG